MSTIRPLFISGAEITAASITYLGAIFPDTYASQQTHNFTDIAVGTPPKRPNRRWLVMMSSFATNTDFDIEADGVAGSQVASASTTGGTGIVLYHRAVSVEIPDGTTVDVTVTSVANSFWNPNVFVLNNINCASASDSSANGATATTSQDIDCPNGGAIVAYGQVGGSSFTPSNCEFRNLDTILEDLNLRSGECISSKIATSTLTALDIDLLVTWPQAEQSSGFAISFPPHF